MMLTRDINLLRAAYRNEIDRLEPNYFITHNFDHPVAGFKAGGMRVANRRPYKAEFALERTIQFYERMFMECYSNAWNERMAERRVAYGFFEGEGYNPHFHVAANLDPHCSRWIEKYGKSAWLKLSSRGQLQIEIVRSKQQVRDYCTKRLVNPRAFENVLVV
jgi:hypothetical protein